MAIEVALWTDTTDLFDGLKFTHPFFFAVEAGEAISSGFYTTVDKGEVGDGDSEATSLTQTKLTGPTMAVATGEAEESSVYLTIGSAFTLVFAEVASEAVVGASYYTGGLGEGTASLGRALLTLGAM